MRISRWYRWTAIAAMVIVLIVAMRTCTSSRTLVDRASGGPIEAELKLQTVTLEQPDENGNLLWRLKAESVTYSPDNQRAELTKLVGEFFQAGEMIYTVTADRGEVFQNGETLFLRGNLVAKRPEDELTLEGETLKWQPKQDLLVMGNFDDEILAEAATLPSPTNPDRAPVTGFNPQIEAAAQVVTVSSKENRVDLTGGVVAKSKEVPWMTFESNQLTWLTRQELIETSEPLKVERYDSKDYKSITDRVVGNAGEVQLAENTVTLNGAVRLDSLTQPLIVRSEQAIWDLEAQTVALDQPVNLAQPERKITASASRANLDLAKEVVYLIGNVRASGEKNDARLAADRLTWQTTTQAVEAEGNVSYQQAANPEVSMTGPRAVGNFAQGTLAVTGGESGEVVTEIRLDEL
ncbi:MAG: LPS export ABC transporter periplasmic protein LptC [Phormidesmis sp.]